MEIRVIGVPMDLGADRRGVDMGPSAVRYAGLDGRLDELGHEVTDAGNVAVPPPETREPDAGPPPEGHAKYLEETAEVSRRLREEVESSLADGAFPLALGGDHSISIGSVGGSATVGSTGVVWFDAHADFNTPETTPSGNVHGMPLAALLGGGHFDGREWANAPTVSEENVAIVGLRSVDDRERDRLNDSDVTGYTMGEIDERGFAAVCEEAFGVATDGTDGIHVSFDMDLVDPGEAPGVGTPVRGGITYREAHTAMDHVDERFDAVRSMDVVEVNPILDSHNRTAELAVDLLGNGFGERVL
jgi:arginase